MFEIERELQTRVRLVYDRPRTQNMRKEILVVIFIGIIVGLTVAFGVWRANSALKPKESLSDTNKGQNQSQNKEVTLSIVKPEENDVITQSPILFSGITKPNSWIVISAEEKDHIIKTNESGTFEKEIDLVGGINQIIVTSFDDKETKAEQKINLVFSTEFEK